jgi:hypothetical protein
MCNSFEFVSRFAPDAAEFLAEADANLLAGRCWESIARTGTAIEMLFRHIVRRESRYAPEAVTRCMTEGAKWLKDTCHYPKSVASAFARITQIRNRALHENSGVTRYNAELCLKLTHHILQWCFGLYHLGQLEPFHEYDA